MDAANKQQNESKCQKEYEAHRFSFHFIVGTSQETRTGVAFCLFIDF